MHTKGFALSDECIHGLDGGLCDLCFPKAAPEVVARVVTPVSKRASRAREAQAPTSLRNPPPAASKASASTRSPAAAKPAVGVGEQRIYHVTHVSNLANILSGGSLLADASEGWGTRPTVDISSGPNREARRAALVSGEGSLSVANYVPFFLSPDASVWDSIRANTANPRLTLDAHGSTAFDFVVLVSTVKTVIDAHAGDEESPDASVVVADGDAAAESTRFGASPEASERVLRKLRADQDPEAILAAEFLVKEEFPFELVSLVGVANSNVRNVVKDILAASAYRPKVSIYPPWFNRTEVPVLQTEA